MPLSLGLSSPPSTSDDVRHLFAYAEFVAPAVSRLALRIRQDEAPLMDRQRVAELQVWRWARHHEVLGGIGEFLAVDDPAQWRPGPSDGKRAATLAMRDIVNRTPALGGRAVASKPVVARYREAWVLDDGSEFDVYTWLACNVWARSDPAGRFVHEYDRDGPVQAWAYATLQAERGKDQPLSWAKRWRKHAEALGPAAVEAVAQEFADAREAVDLLERWQDQRQPYIGPPASRPAQPVTLRR